MRFILLIVFTFVAISIDAQTIKPQNDSTLRYFFGNDSNAVDAFAVADENGVVNLSAGRCWYDYETFRRYDGGIKMSTRPNAWFVAGGTILPICRNRMNFGKNWNELDLLVFPGDDAILTLGKCNVEENCCDITFRWKNRKRLLLISECAFLREKGDKCVLHIGIVGLSSYTEYFAGKKRVINLFN